MDYTKVQLLGDKALIRITSKDIQDIYSKEITRIDGTKTRLFINVPAEKTDDRQSGLFVRTGQVINIGRKVNRLRVGDIAILSYEAFNDETKLVDGGRDDEDRIIWVHANTTYHKEDLITSANRKVLRSGGRTRVMEKDTIVWKSGEVDELSQIIGWIRDDQLFANDPYVFLNHEEIEEKKTTFAGIQYTETKKLLHRTVLAVSEFSERIYGISKGDKILVKEADTFDIKLFDGKITCVNDSDVMWKHEWNTELKPV